MKSGSSVTEPDIAGFASHHNHVHKAATSLEVNAAKRSRRMRTEKNELIFSGLGDFSVKKSVRSQTALD